uniref:Retrotransposon protein, putative, unclassified n=1 Tax=Oryza sativa subsp. japonica TaxID=39947 RepID=Q2QRZ9_ORYSJ|nr:retrotransposon protein, putative, unclassified [Oryza sativa Japonica Group]
MTKQSSSKAEVEPTNVIPITLDDFEGEDRKSMEEYIKEITHEALIRACTRTRQGVIIKPGPRPKLTPDLVSNEEVTQSIQQQDASAIDSSMVIFKNKLDATIEGRFDEFLRTKFGPLMADFMLKDKASTSASQAPTDQTSSRTDGAAQMACPTGPDGRSDRDFAIGPTGQMAEFPNLPSLVVKIDGQHGSIETELRLCDLTSVKQKYNEPAVDYIKRIRDVRNQCYSLNITDRDLAGLAFNGLIAPLRERLDGQQFLDVSQLMQKALAQESWVKDNKKFVRPYEKKPNVNFIDYPEASDSEGKDDHDMYVAEWSWTNKNKPFVCSNLMPTPCKYRQSEVKYSFDVAKCDKIFDYLLQEKQIRLPKGHIVPSQEELKRRAYCKWHDSHSHSTNDCNVFRRQVQSAIDEGRLKFIDGSKMKLDHDPFPMNTINFNDKKVLIRPEQAESTKGKGEVIGEPRPKMIVPKKPEVGVWKENNSEASTSKTPRKTKVTFDMLLGKYEKQGGEKARNKGKRPRSPPREQFGHSPRRSESPQYNCSQNMSWGPYPMPPSGYTYPYYMPWGATPPMFNHMPPIQFNQGWGGPRRTIHEHLSSPNNGWFYDEVGESSSNKPEAGTSSSQSAGLTRPSSRSDRNHTAGLTGPSGRSDCRPDDGPTDASGRSDRPPNVDMTGVSGRSDRWSTSGLTGLQRQFDRRFAKGNAGALSSSSKLNRGHYLPPGTELKPRWIPKYLTATQRRRLQRLRAQEIREQKAEEQRDRRFNELRPPPVWRRKSIEKEEPVVVEEKEEQSVAKDEPSTKEDMDINMVYMLPIEFCAMDEAEVAQFSLGPKDAVFEKPDESNCHMKPLYLKGHIDGKPLGRGDNELKKTNMILNGFNGEPKEAKGIFSVELTMGNKTLPTAFFIVDVQGANLEWLQKRVQEYRSTKNDIGETIEDFDEVEKLGQGFTSADPLEEVKIIELLKEYVDCFAWEYHEMPGLSRELVEHRLPIKPGFSPYKQPPRRFNPLLYDRVKEEIDQLLKAGFTRRCHYAEWVSSIVPVEKKGSGKIRVCMDFRDLNKATPKDEYPMPIADMMINDASGHKVISFLDGNAGNNQIFMTEQDIYKTTFRCPGFVGLFEWVVMTFGLKNAGATYQRAMNLIFHDLLGIILEIYIDDIVVKSDGMEEHIADLRLAFERMRRYGLKMNPLKCAFGLTAGKFLGFMVHERGVEIDPKKIEKIRDFKAPTCKKEVQKLLGKIDAFVPILRLKKEADFTWGAKQQEAFEELKRYLSTPPVVRAPKAGKPFRLYIASEDKVIGAVLTQEEDGKEYIITYFSRRLLDAETSTCIVACQANVIKHMLQRPILSGRIGKWAYALIEYDLAYEPLKSVRGQNVCDFIVEHHVDIAYEEEVCLVEVIPWKIYFDGSSCKEGQGIGVVLFSPNGMCYEASVRLEYYCTNNQAKYNALLFGLQIMEMVGAKHVEAFGDSELVVQRVAGFYKCLDGSLNRYLDSCLDIIANFDNFTIRHIARHDNSRANDLAQQASGYNVKKGLFLVLEEPVLDFKSLCEIGEIGDQGRSDRRCAAGLTGDQVRYNRPHAAGLTGDPERSDRPLIRYLKDPTLKVDRKIRYLKDWRIPLIRYLKDPTLKANGQAESSNKTLLKLVKKKIEEHPKRWHEVLSEALWAHRISKHGATKVTPFELVYCQEVVLPIEVNLGSLRYIKQDDLLSEDYKTFVKTLMMSLTSV